MKVKFEKGVFILEAETIEDNQKLYQVAREQALKIVGKTTKRGRTYKRQFTKKCPICGKAVKGATGLASHKRFNHKEA